MKSVSRFRIIRFLPIAGIVIYWLLYILAARLYPGGSPVSKHTLGFDWINNYWCHLMDVYAINGQLNDGRSYAMAATLVLAFSMGFFFYQYPLYLKLKSPWRVIVPISGILAAITSLFVYSGFHDLMAMLTAFFATLAIIGIFHGLKGEGLIHFLWTGILCVLLIILNGYIFLTENFIQWLPLIQKITFIAVMLWVVLLNVMFGSGRELVPVKESIDRLRKKKIRMREQ